jgi:outer membrane autotransporter protein
VSNTKIIALNGAGTAAGIGVNQSQIAGGVSNAGSITASGGVNAAGIAVSGGTVTSNGITNTSTGTITVSGANTGVGIVLTTSAVSGGVSNAGMITATSASTAFGIEIVDSSVSGGIANSGTIRATGKTVGIGIAVSGSSPITGGIVNAGNITGSSAAISLAGETGVSNTVTQAGGTIAGNIVGSGNTKGDVLNVTGGQIVLAPNQSISGFGTYNQTGGTLVFSVTQSTTPGTYPTLSANAINLRGGTLELVPAGNLAALAAQGTTLYKNAILADPPLNGSFASVTTPNLLFKASVSPDATTPNSLDATLTLNKQGVTVSAQDLTQDLRLALDAPRVLTEAVQDRLVANGGALGEWSLPGAPSAGAPSPLPIGHASVWARGYDQFGSAAASASIGAVGYGINRAAPLIGGIDWRLGNDIVTGVAATYVASSASFKDGSRTNLSSYQGAIYAGWAGGPWYALGSAVVSFNDFGTSRLLTPFGLAGDAASKPSGESYQGHAEAGYHWVLPAAGVNVSVTPYAAIDYVNAHIESFNETGGFGAFSVNAAGSNSFQTTLGVRLTSRIQMASYGMLVPELRLGWSHEFLDSSQTIVTTLIGVPGSLTSTTGINFGRDTARVGAGLSMELDPDAKVFVDYDGKLSSRLQEHSVSGGLRLRF